MKALYPLVLAGVLALSAGTSVHAVVPPPVLSPDTYLATEDQVLTLGTEVYGGRNGGGGTNFTLTNGVSFNSHFSNASFVGTDLGSGITVKTDGAYYGSHSNLSAFSDSALNNTLEGDSQGSYGQLFVDGLVTGHTYVIQLFASMTQSGSIGGASPTLSATESVSDQTQGGTTTLSYGQTYDPILSTYSGTGVYFITDTFTAVGNEEYLLIYNSTNGVDLQSAVQVRDLTDVPEPSTYAMIGLGLAGLLALGRFRRLTA